MPIKVEVGQVWECNDPRQNGRRFRIDAIINGFALSTGRRGQLIKIRLERFASKSARKGYTKVEAP